MKHYLLPFFLQSLSFADSVQAATIFGPVPYRQQSDSPFYSGLAQGTILLEDFEDDLFNIPGAAPLSGRLHLDQGVDEDDGLLDGLGQNMVWLASGERPAYEGFWQHQIRFEAHPQLGYPTYVGVALLGWTGLPPEFLVGQSFGAYGIYDENLTPGGVFVPSVHLPPGTTYYSSEGVQFVGLHHSEGIRTLLLSGYSFDHLQYGWAIPEPGAVTLSGLTAALFLMRRRRTQYFV